jgi:hypothetical protein
MFNKLVSWFSERMRQRDERKRRIRKSLAFGNSIVLLVAAPVIGICAAEAGHWVLGITIACFQIFIAISYLRWSLTPGP